MHVSIYIHICIQIYMWIYIYTHVPLQPRWYTFGSAAPATAYILYIYTCIYI